MRTLYQDSIVSRGQGPGQGQIVCVIVKSALATRKQYLSRILSILLFYLYKFTTSAFARYQPETIEKEEETPEAKDVYHYISSRLVYPTPTVPKENHSFLNPDM